MICFCTRRRIIGPAGGHLTRQKGKRGSKQIAIMKLPLPPPQPVPFEHECHSAYDSVMPDGELDPTLRLESGRVTFCTGPCSCVLLDQSDGTRSTLQEMRMMQEGGGGG
jgi:hypothetical protein